MRLIGICTSSRSVKHRCKICGSDKNYHAKELCKKCYTKQFKENNPEKYHKYIENQKLSGCVRRASLKYYYNNKDQERQKQRKYLESLRFKFLTIIGELVCKNCGESDYDCLFADHKNNDGYKDRKRFRCPRDMYNYYIKQPSETKDRFQILCANCNWRKKREKDRSLYKLP